jgi:hypothetical protein
MMKVPATAAVLVVLLAACSTGDNTSPTNETPSQTQPTQPDGQPDAPATDSSTHGSNAAGQEVTMPGWPCDVLTATQLAQLELPAEGKGGSDAYGERVCRWSDETVGVNIMILQHGIDEYDHLDNRTPIEVAERRGHSMLMPESPRCHVAVELSRNQSLDVKAGIIDPEPNLCEATIKFAEAALKNLPLD